LIIPICRHKSTSTVTTAISHESTAQWIDSTPLPLVRNFLETAIGIDDRIGFLFLSSIDAFVCSLDSVSFSPIPRYVFARRTTVSGDADTTHPCQPNHPSLLQKKAPPQEQHLYPVLLEFPDVPLYFLFNCRVHDFIKFFPSSTDD
jgi:hypothetical protein